MVFSAEHRRERFCGSIRDSQPRLRRAVDRDTRSASSGNARRVHAARHLSRMHVQGLTFTDILARYTIAQPLHCHLNYWFTIEGGTRESWGQRLLRGSTGRPRDVKTTEGGWEERLAEVERRRRCHWVTAGRFCRETTAFFTVFTSVAAKTLLQSAFSGRLSHRGCFTALRSPSLLWSPIAKPPPRESCLYWSLARALAPAISYRRHTTATALSPWYSDVALHFVNHGRFAEAFNDREISGILSRAICWRMIGVKGWIVFNRQLGVI